jgi:radical SAM superfamily enzyme YgiQ (UPF0313 family)
MKIVFGYASWTGEYGLFGHFAKRNSTWPPLNLALLGAVCEQAGHEAVILDAEANGWTNDRLAREIVAQRPDMVGFSAYSPFFHLSCDVAKAVKAINKGIPVMIGGPHVTITGAKLLEQHPEFDYGFLGEAEDSLPQFLENRSTGRGEPLNKIAGVMWRDWTGNVRTAGPRWVTPNMMKKEEMQGEHPLDRLPLPARHLLPMERYKLGTPRGRVHFTSLQTARGCPWSCIFCASDAIKTKRYIMKSPKRVVEEMADIAARFPFVKHIYIVDDVLTFWPEHVVEICERMDAEGLKFTFESSTRANLVDDKLIARLAKSGLIRLSFGLETIDKDMRTTMQKKVPLDAYPVANRICADNGVEAMNSIMIGLPGETRETFEHLIGWVSEQRDIKQANLAIAIPYPGTEFHEMAVTGAHGLKLLSEDFSEYLRYGNAVTNVGDLTSRDLIEMQNEGFVRIYSKPWRWGPVFHKHGVFGFVLQMYRVVKLWVRKMRQASEPFRVHPGLP